MNSSTQGAAAAADTVDGDVVDAPHPSSPPGIDGIIFKYRHLWADNQEPFCFGFSL